LAISAELNPSSISPKIKSVGRLRKIPSVCQNAVSSGSPLSVVMILTAKPQKYLNQDSTIWRAVLIFFAAGQEGYAIL